MDFLSPPERAFLDAFSHVAYINPFLPERLDFERAALGADFIEGEAVWSLPVDRPEETRKNIRLMVKRLEPLGRTVARTATVGREDDASGSRPLRGFRLTSSLSAISGENIRSGFQIPRRFESMALLTKFPGGLGPHFRAWCCFSHPVRA